MELVDMLREAKGLVTLIYEGEPKIRMGALTHTPLMGKHITKLTRVQVNPVKHYRELKARALGVHPSEVEVEDRPGWEHISPNLVRKEDVTMFQAAPVRVLDWAYLIDGELATPRESLLVEDAVAKKSEPVVELRTYRLDRIRAARMDHKAYVRSRDAEQTLYPDCMQ